MRITRFDEFMFWEFVIFTALVVFIEISSYRQAVKEGDKYPWYGIDLRKGFWIAHYVIWILCWIVFRDY